MSARPALLVGPVVSGTTSFVLTYVLAAIPAPANSILAMTFGFTFGVLIIGRAYFREQYQPPDPD